MCTTLAASNSLSASPLMPESAVTERMLRSRFMIRFPASFCSWFRAILFYSAKGNVNSYIFLICCFDSLFSKGLGKHLQNLFVYHHTFYHLLIAFFFHLLRFSFKTFCFEKAGRHNLFIAIFSK